MQREVSDLKQLSLAITDGAINFLWSFIQGSIMNPDTWNRLLNSYGFCERHAWIYLSIEMSFREQYLLGPTILYQALIERALDALSASRISKFAMARQLRNADACLLCALHIDDASAGASPPIRLDRGRDSGPLLNWASALEPLWRSYICEVCNDRDGATERGPTRCRRHLLIDIQTRNPVDFLRQRAVLRDLHERVTRYQESFLAGSLEASDQDCASLVAAIGWCSGWHPLLDLMRSA